MITWWYDAYIPRVMTNVRRIHYGKMCPVALLRWSENGSVLAGMKNDIFSLISATMQECGTA